ncbi:MAG TPA: non-canonical purine NTP pyrophosphatase [Verrucomicrobiae bacterium]|jgi:XTP/dITP diphosphohydrolase
MITILIATRNAHKVEEIRAILGSQVRCLSLNDFPGAPKVIEDADTFEGNAAKKAQTLAKWIHERIKTNIQHSTFNAQSSSPDYVLADDSGLEVDALNGAPGVHSARFAALDTGKPDNSPDADNNAKLLQLLADVPAEKRAARFRCVIALTPIPEATVESSSPVCYADDFETQTFSGACPGKILSEYRGKGGFGYDPLFVPDGFAQTFAELGEDIKNKISHRAKAMEKLKRWLEANQ